LAFEVTLLSWSSIGFPFFPGEFFPEGSFPLGLATFLSLPTTTGSPSFTPNFPYACRPPFSLSTPSTFHSHPCFLFPCSNQNFPSPFHPVPGIPPFRLARSASFFFRQLKSLRPYLFPSPSGFFILCSRNEAKALRSFFCMNLTQLTMTRQLSFLPTCPFSRPFSPLWLFSMHRLHGLT